MRRSDELAFYARCRAYGDNDYDRPEYQCSCSFLGCAHPKSWAHLMMLVGDIPPKRVEHIVNKWARAGWIDNPTRWYMYKWTSKAPEALTP